MKKLSTTDNLLRGHLPGMYYHIIMSFNISILYFFWVTLHYNKFVIYDIIVYWLYIMYNFTIYLYEIPVIDSTAWNLNCISLTSIFVSYIMTNCTLFDWFAFVRLASIKLRLLVSTVRVNKKDFLTTYNFLKL